MMRTLFVAPILLLIFLVGCSESTTPIKSDLLNRVEKEIDENPVPTETEPSSNPKQEAPDRRDRLGEPGLPGGLERVELTPEVPVVGEVPEEILGEIITDLVERTEAESDSIIVLRAESVVWNDGSLGCPQPGEYYTQAQVPGYWVVLDAGGDVFDYRVTENGYFTLCEGPGLVQPPPGALKE